MPSPDPTRTEHGREASKTKANRWTASSASIFEEIREVLASAGCRCDSEAHKSTPPMMYPEWIMCALTAARQQGAREAAEWMAGLSRDTWSEWDQVRQRATIRSADWIAACASADAALILNRAIRAHFGIGEKE